MSFKSKFAEVLMGFDKALAQVNPLFAMAAPLIAAIDPKAAPVLSKVGGGIDSMIGIVANIEAVKLSVPGMTGPQAAVAAAPQIAQVVLASLTLAGKSPKDKELFKAQSAQLAGLINDIANNFE
jgi:hypothetical protein